MARLSVPYLVRKGPPHAPRWYWQPSADLRRAGWQSRRLLRPDRQPCRTEGEAADAARAINAELERWRAGERAAAPAPRTVAAAIESYRRSRRFRKLAPTTRANYATQLAAIVERFGAVPVARLRRRQVLDWYEDRAETAPAAAAAGWRVLRVVLNHARRLEWLDTDPLADTRVATSAVRVRPWTPAEVAAVMAAADRLGRHDIGDLVMAALTTGQRRGDLLALDRAATAEPIWRIVQQKTGALAFCPLTAPLRARLEAADARRREAAVVRSERFLNEADGWRPWSASAAWRAFDRVRREAARQVPSIAEVEFRDLRDTTLTRLADAGCTPFEMAALSGHSAVGIARRARHYVQPTAEQAQGAVAKLEAAQAKRHAIVRS